MGGFSISSSCALSASSAALELAEQAEAELGGPAQIVGGCLLTTAAAGAQGHEVGHLLADRWPRAGLFGTSFEGILAEGRVWRDQPAMGLLTWQAGAHEPIAVAFEAGEGEPERIAGEILAAARTSSLGPSDLVVLFPDAHGSPAIEPLLPAVEALLGRPAIAGSGASGLEGAPARAWIGSEDWAGGMLGLVFPGPQEPADTVASPLVQTAGGSRAASAWHEITACRARWVDAVGGEPALGWLLDELGPAPSAPLTTYLDRLLVRIRRRASGRFDGSDVAIGPERYVIGIDERRGAFSLPVEVRRGDQVALALPDAGLAREALDTCLGALAGSSWLLQFTCRARDAALHGDPDLESAWVAARAVGRRVLGTVAPFQIGPDSLGACQLMVHSTVLASVGSGRPS